MDASHDAGVAVARALETVAQVGMGIDLDDAESASLGRAATTPAVTVARRPGPPESLIQQSADRRLDPGKHLSAVPWQSTTGGRWRCRLRPELPSQTQLAEAARIAAGPPAVPPP